MSSISFNINRFLEQYDSQLRLSFLEDRDGYWCFVVHGHSALPGVEECQHVSCVQLNDENSVYASAQPWKEGYHGTSIENLLLILAAGGFDNKRSGDTPAGICLASKFHIIKTYNLGGVLQCDIHGFQHPLPPTKVKEYLHWVGEYVPIGMNTKQKKGTKLGQLISHPGNLCIKKVYLDKSRDITQILSRPIQATPGACYWGKTDPVALLEHNVTMRDGPCHRKVVNGV